MLGKINAVPSLAVKDLAVARRFYTDTLGLTEAGGDGEELITFQSGNAMINLYRSQYAGTNQATAMTWAVADVDDIVRQLTAKGVRFEHYDLPGMARTGDVHTAGEMKVAWFKDPDGNILNLVNS